MNFTDKLGLALLSLKLQINGRHRLEKERGQRVGRSVVASAQTLPGLLRCAVGVGTGLRAVTDQGASTTKRSFAIREASS